MSKKFLILGHMNAITYKEIFPLIKDNKMWIGCSIHSNNREFRVPDSYPLNATYTRIDDEGNRYIRVGGVRWFTNLPIDEENKLILTESYYDEQGKPRVDKYPKYDNYDAININKLKDIPKDYYGVMGVPITFIDKYNPKESEIIKFRKGNDDKDLSVNGKCPYCRILIKMKNPEFDIIALGNSRDNFTPNKDYINPKKHTKDNSITSGGAINCVLALNYKEKPENCTYYTSDNSDFLVSPYARVLIKRKNIDYE